MHAASLYMPLRCLMCAEEPILPLLPLLSSIQPQCMTTDQESPPSQDGHQRGCRDNLYTVLVCMECLHAFIHTHKCNSTCR